MGSDITAPDFRYGIRWIGNSTKRARACPLQSKTPSDLANGPKDNITNICKPEQYYSDPEPAFQTAIRSSFINTQQIKHITPIYGAHAIEHFIGH